MLNPNAPRSRIFRALCGLGLVALAGTARAGTPNLLTYQGRLQESGVLVNGNRDVQIFICNNSAGACPDNMNCFGTGNQTVSVSNGLFRSTFTVPSSVDLTLGPWLLEVRENAAGAGTGSGTCLAPREPFTSSPYAVVAGTASNLTPGLYGAGVNFVGPVGIGTANPLGKLQVSTGPSAANIFVDAGSGNVGIWTATPQAPMEVRYTNNYTGNPAVLTIPGLRVNALGANQGQAVLDFAANGTQQATIRADGNGNFNLNGRGQFTVGYDVQPNHIDLYTSGLGIATPALHIEGSGQVGIGTAVPIAALQVSSPTASGSFPLFQVGGGTLTATAGGSVGIGTNLPAAPLDVNGAAQFGFGGTKSTFTATGGLRFDPGYAPVGAKDAATKGYVDSQVGPGGIYAATATWSAQQTYLNTITVSTNLLVNGGGNVGLGTNNPVGVGSFGPVLHMKGTAGTVPEINMDASPTASGRQYLLISDGSNGGSFYVKDQTGGTIPFLINGSSVGVGTVLPALPLDVNGAAVFGLTGSRSTFTATGHLIFPSGYSPAGALEGANKGYVDAQVGAGSPIFGTTGTWSAQQTYLNQITVSTNLIVNGLGSVGIGTQNPSSALDVFGTTITIRNAGGVTEALAFDAFDGSGGFVRRNANTGNIEITPQAAHSTLFTQGNVWIGTPGPAQMFQVGAGTLTATAGGSVGIGTNTPTGLLEVGSASNTGGVSFFTYNQGVLNVGTNAPYFGLAKTYGGGGTGDVFFAEAAIAGNFVAGSQPGDMILGNPSGNNFYLALGQTSQWTPRIFVNGSNGNVGIGTTGPATLLDVAGAAQFGAGAAKSTFTNTGNLIMAGGSILSAANLGVGTANPALPLDVNGAAQFGPGAAKSTFTATGALLLAAGISASTGNFTATGSNQYSIASSSGINVLAGGVVAPYFQASQGVFLNNTLYTNPDYVFEPEYPLRTLDDVRGFVASKKHLPNVPSTRDVKARGVELFEQNRAVLENLEESYLYLFQLDAQLKEQRAAAAKQQAEIEALRAEVERLKGK